MKIVRLAAALIAMAAITTTAFAAEIDWPATEPGRHAREYFPAYHGGESAMRAYFAAHVAAADLEKRPIDARIEVWNEIRGNQGNLTPRRVLESGPDFVEVLAENATGEMLRIRFNCTPSAPHTLLGLRIESADEGDGAAPPAMTPPEPTGPPPTDAEIVAQLGSKLDSLEHALEFSGVAMLDKAGTPLFAQAYGMASRRENRKNTLDTRFNLGSINKIFTAVAIQQLDQAGKLKLDDPIGLHLKDYPKSPAKKVTIRMLLEHKGGVADVLEVPELWENPGQVRTAGDWYALVRDKPLEFEPGTRQQYSNGGYCVLGMIVERVSGEDYYAYVRKHIYEPAGMTRTGSFLIEERNGDDFARGYSRRRDGIARHEPPSTRPDDGSEPAVVPDRFGRPSPAGGGHSTAGDMVRFARALRGGKLLDDAHTAASGGKGIGIGGGAPGINALLEISGDYTLVVMANLDPPAAEQFARTTGRMIRRAAGVPEGARKMVRVGGGAR